MRFFNRLGIRAPRILETRKDPDEYLLKYFDHEKFAFMLGTSATVRQNEYAAFLLDNRIVMGLEPGIQTLDRTQLADLAALCGWSDDFDGPIPSDILYISTLPKQNHVFKSETQAVLDLENGESVVYTVSGTLDFRVSDCNRFAFTQSEKGLLKDRKFYASVDRLILQEFRGILKNRLPTLNTPASNKRELSTLLNRKIRAVLELEGIADVMLKIRQLECVLHLPEQGKPEPVYTLQPAASLSNVTPLRPRKAAITLVPDIPVPESPNWPSDQSTNQEILDIEEDIQRLDAWSSIENRISEKTGTEIGGTPTKDCDNVNIQHLPAEFLDIDFYIAIDEEQTGPFTVDEFEQAIAEGLISKQTRIWFQGLDDWRTVGEIPEIVELLEAK